MAIRISQGFMAVDLFPILFALAAAGIQIFALLNARPPAAAEAPTRD
ncbi:MAG: hypothetical protein GY953_56810 [bacterium]|nr:hypothetical protein [bacterium]